VALATVASRVIYGLRQEVRKALQLGQYTLEEKLGEGGMGTVFRARHAMLRRPTAVKLLPPDKVGESSIERFEREVQNTALLSHPNTVAIFDYGRTPDGVFYYAMEFLDGIDLESLVHDDGPQPPARVVHILRQVCGSLSEAHERGLIHRDIKPANIILCERGGAPDVAKVVDFGLVKDLEQADGITKADTLTGTPFYLSPEAIRGSEVDGRSDLYAVGAVGYYLLCGVNVFEGGTLVEICGHHLHSTPVAPSERLGRALPGGLEAVILACLDKNPDGRPQSARELKSRLESGGDAGPWTEEQAKARWTKHRSALEETRGDRAPDAEGVSALSVSIEGRLG
jgi:serine/threonine protein kinase